MSWVSRISNAFRPGRTAADVDDELQFHVEQRAADLVREGTPPADAEPLARRQLGNRLQLREACHDVKSAVWLESLLQDFRFGLRMIRKHRKATLTAVVSLALALGACTTAFTLIDALIFRPLPVAAPEQLIDLARLMPAYFSADNQRHESNSFSYPQYQMLREAARGDADLFAMPTGAQLAPFEDSDGFSENLRAGAMSGEGFQILGMRPALGRLIQPDDDSPASQLVAVISDSFWKRRYGASPTAIGERLRLGNQSFQIVGIAAPSFYGVEPGYLTDVWLPLSVSGFCRGLTNPDSGCVRVWGRVHPGVNRIQLRERLQAVVTNFLRERVRIAPRRNLRGPQIEQFVNAPLEIRDASTGADTLFRLQFRRPLWILALICALLLLLACSNVGSLMLARASARDAEMALRISLGAGRPRLIRQMLIESGQIAAAAWFLGVGFAALATPALVARLGSSDFPAWLDVAPDAAMLGFAAALSFIAALLFGIVPAVRASATSPNSALKAGAAQQSGRPGGLHWMVSAEIAFSVAVLFLSGLLLLSFRKLISVDLGFNTNNVILFDLGPRHGENPPHTSGVDMLEALRRFPGVQAASISWQRPMGGDLVFIQTPFIRLPGGATEAVRPREVPVSAGFFETMQIRWIAGRDFLSEEIAGKSPAVIVNQAFVDKFFHGQDPIGREFDKIGDDPEPIRQQIVGVVGNAHWNNLREPEEPSIYTPFRDIVATLIVRTGPPAVSLIPTLRKQVAAAAPDFAAPGTILLRDQIDNITIRERLLAILAGFFSMVGLLLAAVGLYGVVNYAAVRRTREIGIRIALGARPGEIMRLILSNTTAFVLLGVGLGIGCGLGTGRYLASQLFAVKPTDFLSLAAPVTSILIVALAAVLPPALRAAKADPLVALKYE
jgi:putative ABC transport system permease protein